VRGGREGGIESWVADGRFAVHPFARVCRIDEIKSALPHSAICLYNRQGGKLCRLDGVVRRDVEFGLEDLNFASWRRHADMGRENRVASELTGRHLGVLNGDLERINRADGAHDHRCAHRCAVDGEAGAAVAAVAAVIEALEASDERFQDFVPGTSTPLLALPKVLHLFVALACTFSCYHEMEREAGITRGG
jgi:hypothetical protein